MERELGQPNVDLPAAKAGESCAVPGGHSMHAVDLARRWRAANYLDETGAFLAETPAWRSATPVSADDTVALGP